MAAARPGILLVDDVDDNTYTLERRLKQFVDADFVVARNGRQALAVLSARRFDLVLMDIRMPEMDGLAALEAMRADMSLRDVPVIMISAVDDFETVIRCIKLGAEDYVQKPFNAELLRARVEAALERKRLRDQEASYLARIEGEKARVDDLLHALLPKSIVSELKSTNKIAPRRHDNVAVLFCDIADFTRYCDGNPPERVVGELQSLNDRFEALAETHGLEKIKTVGDAFVATAGLLNFSENPAAAAVECGLAMVGASEAQDPRWQVRVGVHLGPVVAGAMGRKSFTFDLWGDTVNVAARLAAEAEPGTVVVAGSIWPMLRARGKGQSLGLVEIKGKGRIEIVRYLGQK